MVKLLAGQALRQYNSYPEACLMIKVCSLFAVVAVHTVIGVFGNTLILCTPYDGKQMIEWAGALCCAAPPQQKKCCCEKKSGDDQRIASKQDCCTPIIASSANLPSRTIPTWATNYDANVFSNAWSCDWEFACWNVIKYTAPPQQPALLLLSTVVILC